LIAKIKLHNYTSTVLSTNWTIVIKQKYLHENLRGEDVENCEAFEGGGVQQVICRDHIYAFH
jgi:hypothetical protein